MNKLLPSFTLIELAVALAIGGVVLSVSFSGYQLLVKYQMKASQKRNDILEFEKALAVLHNDYYSAEIRTQHDSQIMFQNREEIVLYEQFDGFVTRKSSMVSDTFSQIRVILVGNDLLLSFKNNENTLFQYPKSAIDQLEVN